MGSYPPESQMNFAIQWFKSWSEFQKDDFVPVLAKKVQADQAGSEDVGGDVVTELVNGMKGMGRPPSLFSCQVKLFNEWWSAWAAPEREKMLNLLKEADPQFYSSVESEMKGTRIKGLDEEFMLTPNPEEDSAAKEEEGTESAKPEIPVFTVTKVVVDGGSGVRVNFNGEAEENADQPEEADDKKPEVAVGSNGNDSEEPVATEI